VILEGLWRAWGRLERGLVTGYERLAELDRQWARPGTLVGLVILVGFFGVIAVGWLVVELVRKAPYVGLALLVVIVAVVVLAIRDLRADVASMDMSNWDDRPPAE